MEIEDLSNEFDKKKRKKSVNTSGKTLDLLRKEGKIVGVTEHWNAFTHQRKDLFGFIDIIALDINEGKTWGIQTTSASNMNARIKKICTECRVYTEAWLKAGNFIEVIGWAKKGAKGKRKTWQPTRKIIDKSIVDSFLL